MPIMAASLSGDVMSAVSRKIKGANMLPDGKPSTNGDDCVIKIAT